MIQVRPLTRQDQRAGGAGDDPHRQASAPLCPTSPQIQQAIHGNLQRHTVLIVAHRLSTVERAHLIVVLDKGRVVQQGTHQQLLAQGGLYAKLVQRQILSLESTAGYQETPGSGGPKA